MKNTTILLLGLGATWISSLFVDPVTKPAVDKAQKTEIDIHELDRRVDRFIRNDSLQTNQLNEEASILMTQVTDLHNNKKR